MTAHEPILDAGNAVEVEVLPQSADAHAILAKGSKSFSFAGLFLAATARDDAALLYALCRYVDDVADDAPNPETAKRELAVLEAELRGTRPARPFLADVLAMFRRCEIDPLHAVELVRGVSTDVGDGVRLADDRELLRYSYGVAGTVGLMMCGVLGVRDPDALPFAIDLGIAMQLTNISRDVAEDARNDRVYLSRTRLEAAGVEPTPEGVLAGRAGIQRVVCDVLDLSDRYYRSAEQGMRYIPWRARLAILVASRVYRAIGVKLRRHDCDALAGRTVVSTFEKIAWALVGVWRAMVGMGRPARHHAGLHRSLDGLPGAHTARGG